MDNLSPKQQSLMYDKLLAKTYGVDYSLLAEKFYDALFLFGINKYQRDLKKELTQFDGIVNKYEDLVESLKHSLEGSVEYSPKLSDESLIDFVRRIKRIPSKKKGIRFNYEFAKEMASFSKDQFLYYDSKEKELELSLGELRSELDDLDSKNSPESKELIEDIRQLEKELVDVRRSKEQTHIKFNSFYNETKRSYEILRRNEILLNNVDSYIQKVKSNKEILESYLGGGDDLQLIYKLDSLSRDLSDRSEHFEDLIGLVSDKTKDSLEFINSVPNISSINSNNNLSDYVNSLDRKSRTYSSEDILEKAMEIGI
jgi:F0F1-type ATP synthase delta subunit